MCDSKRMVISCNMCGQHVQEKMGLAMNKGIESRLIIHKHKIGWNARRMLSHSVGGFGNC